MAVDEGYGIVPDGMYEDLEHLPLDLFAVMSMCMVAANDHGLFEGRASAFARSVARSIDEIGPRLAELERRNLIAFYDAPTDTGRTVRVGEIVGFLEYRGQSQSRVQPSRRRRSVYPIRDGSFPAFRGHSGDDGASSKPSRTQRGTSAERPRSDRGATAEQSRSSRGNPRNVRGAQAEAKAQAQAQAQALSPPQGEREQATPARVRDREPQPSAAAAPLGGAPPGEPARGDGPAAPRGATPSEPMAPAAPDIPHPADPDPDMPPPPDPGEVPGVATALAAVFGMAAVKPDTPLPSPPPGATNLERARWFASYRDAQRQASMGAP